MTLLLKVCVLFFSVLFFTDLTAQTDFRPGYIITNENDTLNGFIDYRGDTRNSKRCEFRETENGVSREFLPFTIKGYRFSDSKYYVSKTIKTEGKEFPLFLEFLVNGISDLYYYTDGVDFFYFIEKSDGQLLELIGEQKRTTANGVDYTSKTKKYIGLLKYAFADCQQLFPLINNARLEDKSLIDITKKYHEYVCKDETCVIYEKQIPAIKVRFAPFISMNSSFLRFYRDDIYSNLEFDPSTYPMVGFLMNTSLPKANEKISFQISAEAGKGYFYGTGTRVSGDYFDEVHIHSTLLKLKAGFKYTYPTGKIRPTLMVGMNAKRYLKSEGRRIEEIFNWKTIYSREWNDAAITQNLMGYNIDLGIDYHISTSFISFFSFGYDNSITGGQLNDSYPYSTNFKTISLNAGIYF